MICAATPRVVPVAAQARKAYPFMRGIVFAVPGTIVEDEASGVRVRVRADGGLDEIGAVPLRKSAAADPSPRGAVR